MLSFAAQASDVLRFATIDRVARDAQGTLSGFQRPQVAGHIREIRDYLEGTDAILPNPIVVAFTSGVIVEDIDDHGRCTIAIDVSATPPGLVVDGQQRLSALAQVERDFQLFVSAVLCEDEAELRRQFVLINNTKPLPKSLIYELLPSVGGLPRRMAERALAADLTAALNYAEDSPLKGMIHQHTNPEGVVRDTAIQRVVMNSVNDGVMRSLMKRSDGRAACIELIGDYYRAVQTVFPDDWNGQTPKTSRLVHGAGIVAMGYVMETLADLEGARTQAQFEAGLQCLKGRTAWTSGEWSFRGGDRRHWKAIQNVNRDIILLAEHLIEIVRHDIRRRQAATAEPTPLLKSMSA